MRRDRFLLALGLLSLGLPPGCGDGSGPRDTGGTDLGTVADVPISTDVPSGTDTGGIDTGESDGGGTDAGGTDAGDGSVSIFQIQDPARPGFVPVGTAVRVVGAIVAAVDTYEDRGVGMGFVGDVWVADPAGGPHSGVHVYMPTHTPCGGATALALGNVVTVTGMVQEFAVPSDTSGRTVTQLVGGTVTCTAVGDGMGPAPRVFADPAELLVDATAEPWEGVLIQIGDVDARRDIDMFGTQSLSGAPPLDDDLYRHPGTRRDHFVRATGIFHYMFGRYAIQVRRTLDVELGAPRVLEWEDGLFGCADGADRDGDGDIDCADDDCGDQPFCPAPRFRVQDVQDTTSATRPTIDTRITLIGPLAVTSIDVFEEIVGPTYTGTIVVQDPAATADPRFSGIHLFAPDTIEPCAAALAVGDRVYVNGRYTEFASTGGALTEIVDATVSCQAAGAPLMPRALADIAELSPATAEPWEGVLVRIAATPLRVSMPPGAFGRYQVTDTPSGDPGARVVNIDDDLHRLAPAPTLATRFSGITGVLTYQNEFQLEPRSMADYSVTVP